MYPRPYSRPKSILYNIFYSYGKEIDPPRHDQAVITPWVLIRYEIVKKFVIY